MSNEDQFYQPIIDDDKYCESNSGFLELNIWLVSILEPSNISRHCISTIKLIGKKCKKPFLLHNFINVFSLLISHNKSQNEFTTFCNLFNYFALFH